jgi:hypothetical protein
LRVEGGIGPSGQGAGPFTLSCLAAGLEEVRWRLAADEEWSTYRPLVWRDRVVVGRRGRLQAVALDRGELLGEWQIEGVPRGLGASSDRLFVGTLDGRVMAFEGPARGD